MPCRDSKTPDAIFRGEVFDLRTDSDGVDVVVHADDGSRGGG
jgi:hypothetical protein